MTLTRVAVTESLNVELSRDTLELVRAAGLTVGAEGDVVAFEFACSRNHVVTAAHVVWPDSGERERVDVLVALACLDAVPDFASSDVRKIDVAASMRAVVNAAGDGAQADDDSTDSAEAAEPPAAARASPAQPRARKAKTPAPKRGAGVLPRATEPAQPTTTVMDSDLVQLLSEHNMGTLCDALRKADVCKCRL